MSALWLAAIVAYSVQFAAVVAAASLAAWVFRIHSPRPALFFWNGVLIATAVLPIAFGWQPADEASVTVWWRVIGVSVTNSTTGSARGWISVIVLSGIFSIVLLRLGWLGLGLLRLRAIRDRSQALVPLPAFVSDLSLRLGTSASVHVSDDVECPVTIGFRTPLVLLPRRTLDLPQEVQRAVVCHELVHVRRRDWLRTVVEQVWSALLWFHPAAHALAYRIGLMREAVVDRETMAITGDRRAYARALLAFAESPSSAALPVMSLIKPRHLPRRIAFIAREARMSRRHSVVALVSALSVVTFATGATARRIPINLAGFPAAGGTLATQEVFNPGDGISLPRVINLVRPEYTEAALKERIQGSVRLGTVVRVSGEPADIRVTQSLDAQYGLDDAAIQALSQSRFEPGTKDGKPVPVRVEIEMTFTLK